MKEKAINRTEKRCPACNEIKNVDCFHKNKARHDGRAIYCRTCRTSKEKECPSYEPYRKQYYKDYYVEHKDDYRNRWRKWKILNYERSKELSRVYSRNSIHNLSDRYIREVINKKFSGKYVCGISAHIPKHLIDLTRQNLILKRELKNTKDGDTATKL